MREAFRVFDKDGDGNIPEAEMRNILMSLGTDISEEEIEELMREGDTDGTGCFTYGEFITMMTWPDKLKFEAEEREEQKRIEEEEKRIAELKAKIAAEQLSATTKEALEEVDEDGEDDEEYEDDEDAITQY